MRYAFAIDQRSCIGCHACTVACKTEHEVPLGQFRTWVKHVDAGTYPTSTRQFAVLRCNHCSNPPCVAICPTKALFVRPDGIVDFDRERCIGCKSCMQACPYDAIYLDADDHTAAKCNFCAHRVDAGLEPACVVVCPTHSIWVGDIEDDTSGISRLLAANDHLVRAPEQGTRPNVYYVGSSPAVLDPLAAPAADSYLYATPDAHRAGVARHLVATGALPASAAAAGAPRTTLDTAHPPVWGRKVTAYLWTKGVGAGALGVAGAALLAGSDLGHVTARTAASISLAATAATGALLVADLKRPERFWYLLAKPNPGSWLVRGAVALGAHAALSLGWLASPPGRGTRATARIALGGGALASGIATAGYTAALFGQAEGRDLWQSRLLLPDLLAQAAVAGAGSLLAAAAATAGRAGAGRRRAAGGGVAPVGLATTLSAGAAGHLALLALEYRRHRHESAHAAAAARLVTHGPYRRTFAAGAGAVAAGAALGVAGSLSKRRVLAAAGGLLANAGLLAYESVYVRAGQDVPLS